MVSESKKGYFRSRGWKDLIFLAVLLTLAGVFRKQIFGLTDFQKWKARPGPDFRFRSDSHRALGENGQQPCFFIVPTSAASQPVSPDSVGDCLSLVPNGKKLDLIEVFPVGALLLHIKTDLYVPDVIPLAFTRVTLASDLIPWARRFQVYLPNVYDPILTGSRQPWTYLDWLLPDGQSLHYPRTSPGANFSDAVYEYALAGSFFSGSKIAWNGWGWDLVLTDGTTYLSPEAYNAKRPQQGSLVGIFDSGGHEVRLSRSQNGDLEEIKSPNAHWIRLSHAQGLVSEAEDDFGQTVHYQYSSTNMLSRVNYSTGQAIQYSYNPQGQLTEIQDTSGALNLRASYVAAVNTKQELFLQTISLNGNSYAFHVICEPQTHRARWTITDPQKESTTVDILYEQSGEVRYSVKRAIAANQ